MTTVYIDNKLTWTRKTKAVLKKGHLCLLRRLRSFNICRTVLRLFDEFVVASATLFTAACWGSGLRVADANRLNKPFIRKASDVVGMELDSLSAVSGGRMLSDAWFTPHDFQSRQLVLPVHTTKLAVWSLGLLRGSRYTSGDGGGGRTLQDFLPSLMSRSGLQTTFWSGA